MLGLFVLSFWRAQGSISFRPSPWRATEDRDLSALPGLILLRTIGVECSPRPSPCRSPSLFPTSCASCCERRAQLILQLLLISLFSGYLVRIYAWRTILGQAGPAQFDHDLDWALIDRPIEFLIYSKFAIILTLMGLLLPLAVLPLYSSMANNVARPYRSRPRSRLAPLPPDPHHPHPHGDGGHPTAFAFTFLLASGDFVTPSARRRQPGHHDRQRHLRPVPRHRAPTGRSARRWPSLRSCVMLIVKWRSTAPSAG